MTEQKVRSILNSLTDQEIELLIRAYAGRQLDRLMEVKGASAWTTNVFLHVHAHERQAVKWSLRVGESTLTGEVLSVTVDNFLALQEMQKANTLSLLGNEPLVINSDEEEPPV